MIKAGADDVIDRQPRQPIAAAARTCAVAAVCLMAAPTVLFALDTTPPSVPGKPTEGSSVSRVDAVDHERPLVRQLAEDRLDLIVGNVARARQVAGGELIRLAHVEERDGPALLEPTLHFRWVDVERPRLFAMRCGWDEPHRQDDDKPGRSSFPSMTKPHAVLQNTKTGLPDRSAARLTSS